MHVFIFLSPLNNGPVSTLISTCALIQGFRLFLVGAGVEKSFLIISQWLNLKKKKKELFHLLISVLQESVERDIIRLFHIPQLLHPNPQRIHMPLKIVILERPQDKYVQTHSSVRLLD